MAMVYKIRDVEEGRHDFLARLLFHWTVCCVDFGTDP